jgi:hypothetical protein
VSEVGLIEVDQIEDCVHQLYRHTKKINQKMERLLAKMDSSLEGQKVGQEQMRSCNMNQRRRNKNKPRKGWPPRQRPIIRSLRSFKVPSSPGWISTKPGQRPTNERNSQDGCPDRKN